CSWPFASPEPDPQQPPPPPPPPPWPEPQPPPDAPCSEPHEPDEQPPADVCGAETLKPVTSGVSTKSIVAPWTYGALCGSMTTVRPLRSSFRSSGCARSNARPKPMPPQQPPPSTKIR